jgi:hypothetical protein
MPVTRFSPQRGLLAGLLALVTFVSAAVALTARGSATGAAAQATPVSGTLQRVVGDSDGERRFGRHER